jgi:hypothetical protein
MITCHVRERDVLLVVCQKAICRRIAGKALQ